MGYRQTKQGVFAPGGSIGMTRYRRVEGLSPR
jgi:hypothetical protein